MKYLFSSRAIGLVAIIGGAWGTWYLGFWPRPLRYVVFAFGALCAIGVYALVVAIVDQFRKS